MATYVVVPSVFQCLFAVLGPCRRSPWCCFKYHDSYQCPLPNTIHFDSYLGLNEYMFVKLRQPTHITHVCQVGSLHTFSSLLLMSLLERSCLSSAYTPDDMASQCHCVGQARVPNGRAGTWPPVEYERRQWEGKVPTRACMSVGM